MVGGELGGVDGGVVGGGRGGFGLGGEGDNGFDGTCWEFPKILCLANKLGERVFWELQGAEDFPNRLGVGVSAYYFLFAVTRGIADLNKGLG